MPDFADTNDFLSKSTILRRASVNRQFFDPTNKEHLESLHRFINTGNWDSVQFYCEFPFTDVPMTVLTKFARHCLNGASQADEGALAAKGLNGESLLGNPADEAAVG